MRNHNATNERIKRRYFTYLADAQGHSEQTIYAIAKGDRPVRILYPVQGVQVFPYALPSSGALGAVCR
jgi:hypothetical protein